ncbi:MAG: UxaA family hydrolase, partial [Caldilinea sp.]|nr:UxaA family hydrolase [Caldilinea sp.]MDW8441446.1 UxaA family hydrolase [Caldilineaceae bacterium]
AHGTSAEGNPSDGNKLRGLYNITLKSIGAAMKKHPDTRLDYAIDYGERMTAPGFYFMDSPGLDLESVAGQVAAGCNLIYFTTGNGSITNFPFVPTIKVVTTTPRFNLLARDMDVNAGAYLDGTPMDALGEALIDLTLRAASGERTAGERAGHAQVQIWRNWRQNIEDVNGRTQTPPMPPEGSPPAVKAPERRLTLRYPAIETPDGPAFEQVGLILPTSLCAAQPAQLAAHRLNRRSATIGSSFSRFVALPHTEGCSDATGEAITMSAPTLLGYATHRMVGRCLLLEHGCEVVHNDFMRRRLSELGYDLNRFGWASVQLDGGIAAVLEKIEAWFAACGNGGPTPTEGTLATLRLGMMATAPLPPEAGSALAMVAANVAAAGGLVLAAESGYLWQCASFVDALFDAPGTVRPTVAYAHRPQRSGFHVMATPTDHPVEIVTGLGAAGVDVVLAYVGGHPTPGHPLMPVLELATVADCPPETAADLDLVLVDNPSTWPEQILAQIGALAAHRYVPRHMRIGNIDFQITRGLMGISL